MIAPFFLLIILFVFSCGFVNKNSRTTGENPIPEDNGSEVLVGKEDRDPEQGKDPAAQNKVSDSSVASAVAKEKTSKNCKHIVYQDIVAFLEPYRKGCRLDSDCTILEQVRFYCPNTSVGYPISKGYDSEKNEITEKVTSLEQKMDSAETCVFDGGCMQGWRSPESLSLKCVADSCEWRE